MFFWGLLTLASAKPLLDSLPEFVSVGVMFDTEPMLYSAEPYVNYAHGAELHLDFSRGFSRETSDWSELDHWMSSVDFQQFSDSGDLAALMGVVHSPQEIFNPAGFYLGEASVTRNYGDDHWYLKLGMVSMDMDFLAPEIAGLYVHSAFNNQYNLSIENFAISPITALGGVTGVQIRDDLEAKFGVYQVSTVRTDPSLGGFNWEVNRDSGVVSIAQLNHVFKQSTTTLPDGSWQLGTFTSWGEQTDGLKGAINDREPNHGVYGNATIPIQESHRAWMSVSYGAHPSQNPVPLWVGGGWVSEGVWSSRPDDLLMFGASWSQFTFDDWSNRELLLEVESHVMVTENLTLLPIVQYFVLTPQPTILVPVTAGVGIIFEI